MRSNETAVSPDAAAARDVAVVIGCGDIGSAVAHALHIAGLAVVLVDDADPAWPRRGMTFTNAWYLGTAELEEELACFCGSVRSIPWVLRRRVIAATTWSWRGLAGALEPVAIVDAMLRVDRAPRPLLGHAPISIGLGPGFIAGAGVNIAFDLAGYPEMSGVRGESNADRNHSVFAAAAGRFMTDRRIGDRVRAGDVVGNVGIEPIIAPCNGVLRGLTARGARVGVGQELVDVDVRGDAALCFGIGERPRQIAVDVLSVMPASLRMP